MTQDAKATHGQKNTFPELPGFKITEELARSPKGITYKAARLVEGDVVAVKHFRRALCEKKFVEQLPQNAEASFFLEHPNLVRCLGCTTENNRLLLVSEFAPGEALSRLLKRKLPIAASRALDIVLHCAAALQYAANKKHHHGRLHPGDIMVGEESVRVIGVGLNERPEHAAWAARDPQLFEPLVYTALEAMPSQSFPATEAGLCAVDVYALGAILFHLLTGAPPFRGTDEAALVAERQSLRGPVEWPAIASLPPDARDVTDKMLAPEARWRPSFETLVPALTDALKAADKAERTGSSTQVPQALKPAHSGAIGGIRQVPVPFVPEAPHLARWPNGASEHARKRSRDSAPSQWTLVLAVLTTVVFTLAITKVYLYTPLVSTPVADANPAVAAKGATPVETRPTPPQGAVNETPAVPAPVPVQPRPAAPAPAVSPVTGEDPLVAAKQLEMIEDLIKKGEVRHSPALLKVVKRIAETVGKDTPNGLKAVVLAAEIEETLQQRVFPPAAPAVPAPAMVAQVPTPAPANPPPTPAVTPPPANVPPQPVAAKAEEDAAKQKALVVVAIKTAMARAAKFQYADAASELDKAAQNADAESKRLALDFAGLVKQEQAFFLRCRKRLLDEIERNPRKESPLQVRPRKNDPVGDDITDFDEKGLKVSARRGPGAGVRVYEWEKVPPAQAFNLLQNLADKNNLDDQLGVAVFCFNRGLSADSEAALEIVRGLPNGKERGEPIAEICKTVTGLLAQAK